MMSVLEAVGDLACEAEGLVHRKRYLAPQPVAEALALHERHGEPQAPGGFARVEHGEDVGMLQPRGDPDLALEPLGAERGNQVGIQHLEGDRSLVPEIRRQKHDRHSAATELALERVSVTEGIGQLRRRERQWNPRVRTGGKLRELGAGRQEGFLGATSAGGRSCGLGTGHPLCGLWMT